MGAIVDFITGPVLGSTGDAKKWNDSVTNWGDTQAMYDQGIKGVNDAAAANQIIQMQLLNEALNQDPQALMKQYQPMWQQNERMLNRNLASRGLLGGGQAVTAKNNAYTDFQAKNVLPRINSNNALYMNAANQIGQGLLGQSKSTADLYANLGNLRYQNSAGKHMLSLWGGQ